jgi:hypothetical protein
MLESWFRWYCIRSSWSRILLRRVKRSRIRLACMPRASRSGRPLFSGSVPLLVVLDAVLMVGLVAAARNACTAAVCQQVAGTPDRGDAQHTSRARWACQRDTPATASRRSEASLSTGFSCAVHRAAAVRVPIRVTPLRTTPQRWRSWHPGRGAARNIYEQAQQNQRRPAKRAPAAPGRKQRQSAARQRPPIGGREHQQHDRGYPRDRCDAPHYGMKFVRWACKAPPVDCCG